MARPPRLERRRFLQKGALAGAALVGTPAAAVAQVTTPSQITAAPAAQAPPPLTHAVESAEPVDVQVLRDNERAGSDYMIDVFKSLGFE